MIPKFRSFINNKKMFDVEAIDFVEQEISVPVYDEETREYLANMTFPFTKSTLMQSTGLFDKNGVEIFEDDVIRCTHKVTGDVFEGIVRYDNRYGFWGVTDKRFDDLCAIPSAGAYVGYLSEIVFCEVIGNIYENPELVGECE